MVPKPSRHGRYQGHAISTHRLAQTDSFDATALSTIVSANFYGRGTRRLYPHLIALTREKPPSVSWSTREISTKPRLSAVRPKRPTFRCSTRRFRSCRTVFCKHERMSTRANITTTTVVFWKQRPKECGCMRLDFGGDSKQV